MAHKSLIVFWLISLIPCSTADSQSAPFYQDKTLRIVVAPRREEPGMFEPVSVALPIGVVAHDLGQAQSVEHGAHVLHTPANRAGNLRWVSFSVFSSSGNAVPI
ncbi:MAG TPA: hypothetical protein VEQ38_24900 [Verrucomicrobiae bacterium]|nr:hypothetical protein [Verrucomicrobiae bacterium]